MRLLLISFVTMMKLVALTENHEQLHQDRARNQTVAVYVPHPSPRLGSGYVYVKQLIFVLLISCISSCIDVLLTTTVENQNTAVAPIATKGAKGA